MLPCKRLVMARMRSHTYGVLFIIVSMLLVPWTSTLQPAAQERLFTAVGVEQTLIVSSAGGAASMIVEVPLNEALTGLSLELEPSILGRSEAISWTNELHFNHSQSSPEMVDYNGSGLSLMGVDVNWDLNNGGSVPTGWTRSSSTYSQVNQRSCGRNGSTGYSLLTFGGYTWWDSPAVDLSGMSNGDVSFWIKQGNSGCGEEPDSNENLYIQYRTSSGSYVTLRTMSGSTAGGTSSTYTHNLPSAAFHSNFKMRFYQNSGSGSCCDYWFFDDVSLTRPGGEGNWTSPAFGWSPNAVYSALKGPHGFLSIDAKVPNGGLLEWSLLDNVSGLVIPGFEKRAGLMADLGSIDWQSHPDLRLKVHMLAGSGGIPEVYGIHINGRVLDGFHSDPSDSGWQMENSLWSDGAVSGTGNLTSPMFKSMRPISRLITDVSVTGSGQLQVSLDGGSWTAIAEQGVTPFTSAVSSVQFRWIGSGSWNMGEFKVDLDTGGLPFEPRLDVGRDGVEEWSFANTAIGPWGWQDRLSNGALSHTMTWTTNATRQVNIWLPKQGVEEFGFWLTGDATNVSWQAKIGSVLVAEGLAGTLSEQFIELNNTQLEFLSENLSTSTPVWSTLGIEFSEIVISISASNGNLNLHGVRVPYHSSASFSFSPMDNIVQALNDEISSASVASGKHHLPLPLVMSAAGAMKATITDVQSTSGAMTEVMIIRNATQTLVAAEDWIEVQALHLGEAGQPEAVQIDLVGANQQLRVEWPLDGGAAVESGAFGLIEWHPDSPFEYVENGSRVTSLMKFRLQPDWDDEEWLDVRCRLILSNGIRSAPAVESFGAGQYLGVENDVFIESWDVYNEAGGLIPLDQSQLRAGHNVSIEVQVGYDSLSLDYLPRSNVVRVHLFENDIEIANTTSLSMGKALFNVNIPLGANNLVYSLQVEHLFGGIDVSTITLNRTFQSDSLAPYLVNSNIRHNDHLPLGTTHQLRFEVHDRPSLPSELTLMLWRSWIDDWNFDGWPNEGEYSPQSLQIPYNLTASRGNYTYEIDISQQIHGDIVAGYITGTDAAGNPVVGGGAQGADEYLFMFQLAEDTTPLLSNNVSFGDEWKNWIHPGNTYEVIIPFSEQNGLSDVETLSIDLASNAQQDQLQVIWNANNRQCISQNTHIIIEWCEIRAQSGELNPYTKDLVLSIQFTPMWTLPDEGDLRREPAISISDRAGQSTFSVYPELRWRWSTDLMIDSNSVVLEVESGEQTSEGAWVTPQAEMSLSGNVIFAESGESPQESYEVKVSLAGQSKHVAYVSGSFYIDLLAPIETGNHPLTWSLDYLPAQARDVTDSVAALFWVVVDGTGPVAADVVAPRVGGELPVEELGELTFDIRIRELEELNPEGLLLNWKLVSGTSPDGSILASGGEEMTLPDGVLASQQIRAMAQFDLASLVEVDYFLEQTSLHIWLSGSDVAGNPFQSSASFNSETTPMQSWNIEQYKAIWKVTEDDIDMPSTRIEIGQITSISITLRNEGKSNGSADVRVVGLDLSGARTDLFRQDVEVAAGSSTLLTIDWKPEQVGLYWLEIYVDEKSLASSGQVDVRPQESESSFLGVEGVDDTILVVFGILVIAMLAVILLFMKDVISKREDPWEEEEYWDEAESVDKQQYKSQQSNVQAAAAPAIQGTPQVTGGLATQPQYVNPYDQPAIAAPAVASVTVAPPAAVGLTAAQISHNPGVGPGWMQDGMSRWWKQNAEGYWYRLGEDGGWYPPEQNEYGWQ